MDNVGDDGLLWNRARRLSNVLSGLDDLAFSSRGVRALSRLVDRFLDGQFPLLLQSCSHHLLKLGAQTLLLLEQRQLLLHTLVLLQLVGN